MKKYIPSLVLILLFSAQLQAQVTQPMHFEHNTTTCYSTTQFATEDAAVSYFVFDNFGFKLCTSPCPFPPKSCHPKLLNQSDVVQTDLGNQTICIEGEMKFKWICSSSPGNGGGVVIISDTGDIRPGERPGGVKPGGGPGAPNGSSKSNKPYMLKAYPNPSNGQGEITLVVPEFHEQIEIIIQNITGRIIQTKRYNNLSDSMYQLAFDLGAHENGMYIISLRANEKMVDHTRLMLLR